MTSREFAYWIQGFFEITDLDEGVPSTLSATQVQCIRKHLALVFKHEIDGSYPNREELDAIHSGEELKVSPELQKQIDDLKKELATKTEELRKAIATRPMGRTDLVMRC